MVFRIPAIVGAFLDDGSESREAEGVWFDLDVEDCITSVNLGTHDCTRRNPGRLIATRLTSSRMLKLHSDTVAVYLKKLHPILRFTPKSGQYELSERLWFFRILRPAAVEDKQRATLPSRMNDSEN